MRPRTVVRSVAVKTAAIFGGSTDQRGGSVRLVAKPKESIRVSAVTSPLPAGTNTIGSLMSETRPHVTMIQVVNLSDQSHPIGEVQTVVSNNIPEGWHKLPHLNAGESIAMWDPTTNSEVIVQTPEAADLEADFLEELKKT